MLSWKIKCLEAVRSFKQAYVAESNKSKRGYNKKGKNNQSCYNCDKLGHYARECTEPKKALLNSPLNYSFVSSTVMLAETNLSWILDSGATNHVARDRRPFVEYRRIPSNTKWVYVGNNAKVAVKDIGT